MSARAIAGATSAIVPEGGPLLAAAGTCQAAAVWLLRSAVSGEVCAVESLVAKARVTTSFTAHPLIQRISNTGAPPPVEHANQHI